jgi:hypothetical protein
MESLNVFLDTIANQIGAAFLSIIGHSFFFGLTGLVIAFLFIGLGRKRKWFNRSFGLWSFVAKLNYIYLPVLFLVFGASAGVLKGVHSSAGNIIDSASDELVAYGQSYIVDFQDYIANTPIEVAGVSIKDVVDDHLKANTDLGWFSGIAAKAFNVIIVRQCMNKMGIKDASNDPMVWSESFSKEDFSTALLSIPSLALHTECDFIFWGFLVALFSVFTPFFMIPIYEMVLHLLVSFFIGKNASSEQPEFAI